MTTARARLEKMGFILDDSSIHTLPSDFGGTLVRGRFTCVCGKREYFNIDTGSTPIQQVDICAMLLEAGVAAPEHLRADGYTEEQIADIQRRADS